MTEPMKTVDCYLMATRIIGNSFEDPLKLVCLAELLFTWKYTKQNLWEKVVEQSLKRPGTSLEERTSRQKL